MTFEEIHQRLAAKFGDVIGPLQPANKDPWASVKPEAIREVCRFLKSDPDLAFDCLMNLSAIDFPKRAAGPQIDVVYHFWSYPKRHAFILKAHLPRDNPEIDSVESVWKAADWLEREQWDLLGVKFRGHPDLRRIMLPDDWVGHPLRRDYTEGGDYHNITTTRESALDGFVRLDEFKKRAAAATAPAAPPPAASATHAGAAAGATQAPAAPAKKELPQ